VRYILAGKANEFQVPEKGFRCTKIEEELDKGKKKKSIKSMEVSVCVCMEYDGES